MMMVCVCVWACARTHTRTCVRSWAHEHTCVYMLRKLQDHFQEFSLLAMGSLCLKCILGNKLRLLVQAFTHWENSLVQRYFEMIECLLFLCFLGGLTALPPSKKRFRDYFSRTVLRVASGTVIAMCQRICPMTCCLLFFCGLSLALLSFVTQTRGTRKIFRGVLPILYLSQILLKLGKVLMLCVFKNA